MTNIKSTTGFPTSYRWRLKKRFFSFFKNKSELESNEVYYNLQSFFVWKLPAAKL